MANRLSAMVHFCVTGFCLVLLLAFQRADGRAQSLGDLARQEAERRKTLTGEGKVFTNKDVPRVPAPAGGSSPSAAPDAAAAADKPGGKAGAADTSGAPAKEPASTAGNDPDASGKSDQSGRPQRPEKPENGEAYWSGKKKALVEQLDRNQTYAAALQSRINALTTDFVNRDDPAQRAVIANDRQKAVVELDRLKKAIADDKKSLADFEEDARRAGVPPGWIR